MKYYFELQLSRLRRYFKEIGIPIFSLFIIGIPSFIYISHVLFLKVDQAPLLYSLIGILLIFSQSQSKLSTFKKYIFNKSQLLQIKLIEHLCMILPFSLFLLIKGFFLYATGTLLAALIISFLNLTIEWKMAFPTPFSKSPFEFTRGFRKSFIWIILFYLIVYFAIQANNFYLGIFMLICLYLLSMNNYLDHEPIYFVWLFTMTPTQFLWSKIKTGLWQSQLLALPIALVLMFFFPSHWYFIPIAMGIGSLYILISILGKYAFYPMEMPILPGLLIGLCVIIPPLLIFLFPWLYQKSIQNIKYYLA